MPKDKAWRCWLTPRQSSQAKSRGKNRDGVSCRQTSGHDISSWHTLLQSQGHSIRASLDRPTVISRSLALDTPSAKRQVDGGFDGLRIGWQSVAHPPVRRRLRILLAQTAGRLTNCDICARSLAARSGSHGQDDGGETSGTLRPRPICSTYGGSTRAFDYRDHVSRLGSFRLRLTTRGESTTTGSHIDHPACFVWTLRQCLLSLPWPDQTGLQQAL